jgi:hypothetical protein
VNIDTHEALETIGIILALPIRLDYIGIWITHVEDTDNDGVFPKISNATKII